MKTPTPTQLINTRPAALREVLRGMPEVVAVPIAALSEMLGRYIAAAYWTATGEDEQPPTDAKMAPEAVLKAMSDCARFLDLAGAPALIAYLEAGGTEAQMGHDFWLTRNGHGVGFWARDNLDKPALWTGKDQTLGEYLSAVAHSMRRCDLVQGDDGLLYLEGGA